MLYPRTHNGVAPAEDSYGDITGVFARLGDLSTIRATARGIRAATLAFPADQAVAWINARMIGPVASDTRAF